MLEIKEHIAFMYSAFILNSTYSTHVTDSYMTYAFCIYSSSVIKIFNLKGVWQDYRDEEFIINLKREEQKIIEGISKEVNLKWWRKIIKLVLFGLFCFSLCVTIFLKYNKIDYSKNYYLWSHCFTFEI